MFCFFTFQISIQSTDSTRGRFQCGHVCSNPSARTSTDLKVERDVCLSAVVANREALQKKWICAIVSFLSTGQHIQETLMAWVWILRVEQWNAVFGSEFPTRLTNRELWCSSFWSHEAFDLSFAALGTGTTVRGAWGGLVDPEESGLAHPGSKVDDRVWWVTYRPNHRNQFPGRKLAASWF